MNDQFRNIGTHALIALGALGVGAVLVGVAARPLVSAIMTPAAPESAEQLAALDRTDPFERRMQTAATQIGGRSMFFRPAPPPPPPPPPPPERDDPEPEPDPPPASYGGPKINAMINETVWFDNGLVLTVGGEAEGGVRIISWNPPWSARVEWRGVEFDVPLFKRTMEQFLDPKEEDAGVEADSNA